MRGRRDAELQGLIDSVRERYLTDPLFHAEAKTAARVLSRVADMEERDALETALMVLAAIQPLRQPPARPASPATTPMDPAAVAALMGNLAGRPPILYGSGHGVMADHNGDPVCVCGWNPASELPREVVRTQVDALRQVNAHAAIASRPAHGWD